MQQPDAPAHVTHPLDVLKQAVGIGGLTAVPGTAIGAVSGTLRTQTPVLFAIASGIQCFALGSTFWATRTVILNPDGLHNWWKATRGLPLESRTDLKPTRSDKVRASTIAGAFTGLSMGLLFRGPRNAIPGTFMFGLFGFMGQKGYNFLDKKNTEELEEDARLAAKGEKRKNFMERIADMKWSPMEVLTDDRYEEMLQEKLLKLEAEIAIIDDKIEGFRQKAREMAAKEAQEQLQAATQPPPKA